MTEDELVDAIADELETLVNSEINADYGRLREKAREIIALVRSSVYGRRLENCERRLSALESHGVVPLVVRR